MPRVKNRATNEVNRNAPSPVPLRLWQIDPTSQHVVMHLYAEGSSDNSIETGMPGFRLAPEQARQNIRDLSAAVLALDLKMLAKHNDAKGADARLRDEVDRVPRDAPCRHLSALPATD